MGERRAATAGVPGRPGHRRWRGLAGPGLPGRWPPFQAHWTGARRGRPVCGGQGASRWLLPGGQPGLPAAVPGPGARRRIEVAVAWRRARELGRLRRASAAAGEAGQMPSLPGRPAPHARATRTWAWYGWPSPALSPPWPGRAVAPAPAGCAGPAAIVRGWPVRAGASQASSHVWVCRYRCGPVRRPVPLVTRGPGSDGLAPGQPAWPGRVARWAASVAPAGSR